jgi:hypothetical protein
MLRRAIIMPTLVLFMLWRGRLLVAQPVCLARLSVACLYKRSGPVDETGQKHESPESSFECHFPRKDTPIPPTLQALSEPKINPLPRSHGSMEP